MAHERFDDVLRPLGLANGAGRTVLVAFLETAAITVLGFFFNSRTSKNVEQNGVEVVKLRSSVNPLNRATGLEPRGSWDLNTEVHTERARLGAKVSLRSRQAAIFKSLLDGTRQVSLGA